MTALLVFVIILVLPFVVVGLNGVMYFPTNDQAIETMVKLSKVRPGMKVYDLGSGDGRIVRRFAREGAHAVGVEANPLLYLLSILITRLSGISNAEFIWKSLWKVNLDDADIIITFLNPNMMRKYETKVIPKFKTQKVLISHIFTLKTLNPIKKRGDVYVYHINSHQLPIF